MSSDTTGLRVVDLKGNLRSDLDSLNVEEAAFVSTFLARENVEVLLDVMSARMQDREEQHSIGDLSVEPLRLVKRHPSSLGP